MPMNVSHILLSVFRAGAEDVDERDLQWAPHHFQAIDEAMKQGLLRRISFLSGSRFSLTRAGYKAIGVTPPALTKLQILKMIARFFLFVR